jgi:hypothetical protein
MDATLAKYMAMLAKERRGRGWRVPAGIKQLAAQWARQRLARGEGKEAVARQLNIAVATLNRWLENVPIQSAPRTAAESRLAEPRVVVATAVKALPMRTVRIADDEVEPGSLPGSARGNAQSGTMRILLFEQVDLATVLAVTKCMMSSTMRQPC